MESSLERKVRAVVLILIALAVAVALAWALSQAHGMDNMLPPEHMPTPSAPPGYSVQGY